MHRVILTELGISVYDGPSHARSFPFGEPAAEYLAAKGGSADGLSGLAEYLSGLGPGAAAAVSDAGLLAALRGAAGIECRAMDAGDAEAVQASKPEILVESGLASDQADAMSRLRDFALALSSSRVAEASGSADMHIIQAVRSLDDVDKMANLLDLRMREWYGLHFPELASLVDGVAGYARVVLAGRRGGLAERDFEAAGFDAARAQMLAAAAGGSRGGDMSDEDLEAVQGLARQVGALHELRGRIEARLEGQMARAAPNLAAILGASVGARVMARAGSLRRLAMMPASTIQLLGAEKALFRSLKAGSSPPKHGLLFQHPLVHAAPRWQRGKVARAVAAKAAIAARVDLHEPRLNESLLEKLNVRVGEIGKKYAEPPEPREPREGGGRDRTEDRQGQQQQQPKRRPPPRERYGQRRPRGEHGGQGGRAPPRAGRKRYGDYNDDGEGRGRGRGGYSGGPAQGKKGRYGGGRRREGGHRRDYDYDDDGGGGGKGRGRGRGGGDFDRGRGGGDFDRGRGGGDFDRGRGGGGDRGGDRGGAFGRPFGGRRRTGGGDRPATGRGREGGYGRRRQGRGYDNDNYDDGGDRGRGGDGGSREDRDGYARRGPAARGQRRGGPAPQGKKGRGAPPSWAPRQGGGRGAGPRSRQGAGGGPRRGGRSEDKPRRRKRF